MYISKIKISNYKGFDEAEIELQDGLNVILGHNNGGKSTLLDAISLVIDTEISKKISVWDFNQNLSLELLTSTAPSVKISLFFSMSDGEQNNSSDAALFSSYALCLEPKLVACLTYVFYLPETESEAYKDEIAIAEDVCSAMKIIKDKFIRKYTYAIYGGKESLHQKAAYEDLHKIDFQKVDALRNVEGELFSGRAELLHDVLCYFLDYDIKNSEKIDESKNDSSKDDIKKEIITRRKEFQKNTKKEIDALIERLKEGKNQIIKYANSTGALYNESDLIFDGAITEEQLLRVLNILVSTSAGFNIPIANNGLGYNNLIYISLLLAKIQSNMESSYMGAENTKAFSVLAIEEPEAHLHPELQYQFLDFLRKNISDNKVKQVFMTSHSPSLTAKVELDELCCLFKNENYEITAYYPRKIYARFPKSKKFVQRYLNATRADMLFAGKILFVEGLAEQILIPVFIEMLGYKEEWLKQQAVIVNIGGRYFEHFLKMYDGNEKDTLPITIACITDRDPMRKKKEGDKDKEDFTCCWPIEYNENKIKYDYKNHSESYVNDYASHPNIHFFSQNEEGKTFEYEFARVNFNNQNILSESMSNKNELKNMMCSKSYKKAKLQCNSKTLTGIYSKNETWKDLDKQKGLIAARYLKSVQKGENALELANSLMDLPAEEKKKIKIPPYIKDAIEWLLGIGGKDVIK